MPPSVPDLDTVYRQIPWSILPNPNSRDQFRIDVTVNGTAFNVPVDTGSTGFLVSARYLNFNFDRDLRNRYQPAYQYLSSSRRYYRGFWVPSTLTFTLNTGRRFHSKVPVLAVTERGRRLVLGDGRRRDIDVEFMPHGIKYMGIGFGRWGKEQPDATADKNPLLNVDFGDDTGIRSGYIVSDRGVVLGIRDVDVVDEWRLIQLPRNNHPSAPTRRPEWRGIPMHVRIAEGQWFRGTALFDTGIDYSFLGVPSEATKHIRTKLQGFWVLKHGTEVAIRIGNPGHSIVDYSFEVGNFHRTPQITPLRVRLSREHEDGAFINTGRSFFNGFQLLFDESNGVVGFKRRTCSSDASVPEEQKSLRSSTKL